MVSKPSGLLTCLVRFSALRTTCEQSGLRLGARRVLVAHRDVSDAAAASDRTVLVLGDSLSAGYGIKPAQGWVALLEKRLQRPRVRIPGRERQRQRRDDRRRAAAPAARTGTAQARGRHRGARRERWAARPARGADPRQPDEDRRRLRKQRARRCCCVGMRLPPNYGPRYTNDFMQHVSATSRRRAKCRSCRFCFNPSR